MNINLGLFLGHPLSFFVSKNRGNPSPRESKPSSYETWRVSLREPSIAKVFSGSNSPSCFLFFLGGLVGLLETTSQTCWRLSTDCSPTIREQALEAVAGVFDQPWRKTASLKSEAERETGNQLQLGNSETPANRLVRRQLFVMPRNRKMAATE